MSLIKSISGIRGTIGGKPGNNLTPTDILVKVYRGLRAVGEAENEKIKKVVIGRDARISGPMVNNLVAGALQSIGIDVIDLGLSTTPTVELAVADEKSWTGESSSRHPTTQNSGMH